MKKLMLICLPLFGNAKGPANSEDLKHAQTLMESGTQEFREGKEVSTYIEGIPPISYKGKPCSQTTTARIVGTKVVSVDCYFDQDEIGRQCSFKWNEGTNLATITVQTYEYKTNGTKKTSIQSNSDIVSKPQVTWTNVAATASTLINSFCGADLKKKSTRTYTSEPTAPLTNGIPCRFENRWDTGEEVQREINCYNRETSKTLQCIVVDDQCIGITYSVIPPKHGFARIKNWLHPEQPQRQVVVKPGISRERNTYEDFNTAAGNAASTQKCTLSEKLVNEKKPSDGEFKKIAYEWLNRNCK